jgi:hypothetical protein
VGRARVQDERILERDPGDRAALRSEPAGSGELVPVEAPERSGDLRSGGTW